MNLEKSQYKIRELMTRFVTEIKVAGAMDKTDINRVSENVLVLYCHRKFGPPSKPRL